MNWNFCVLDIVVDASFNEARFPLNMDLGRRDRKVAKMQLLITMIEKKCSSETRL